MNKFDAAEQIRKDTAAAAESGCTVRVVEVETYAGLTVKIDEGTEFATAVKGEEEQQLWRDAIAHLVKVGYLTMTSSKGTSRVYQLTSQL